MSLSGSSRGPLARPRDDVLRGGRTRSQPAAALSAWTGCSSAGPSAARLTPPFGSELTAECQAFRGARATKVLICWPADPEAECMVGAAARVPGAVSHACRSSTGPADFNAQISSWLSLVNTRTRRALGCAPTDRLAPTWSGCCRPSPRSPAGGPAPGWARKQPSGHPAPLRAPRPDPGLAQSDSEDSELPLTKTPEQ